MDPIAVNTNASVNTCSHGGGGSGNTSGTDNNNNNNNSRTSTTGVRLDFPKKPSKHSLRLIVFVFCVSSFAGEVTASASLSTGSWHNNSQSHCPINLLPQSSVAPVRLVATQLRLRLRRRRRIRQPPLVGPTSCSQLRRV